MKKKEYLNMNDTENTRFVISKRIQEILDKNNMKQSDLAKILKVSESTVGKWILMKSIPRMGIIQKLSDYFNIPKSYFLEESTTYRAKCLRIPVLDRVTAEIPIEAITDVKDWEEIPASMSKTGEYFALKITESSMEPRMMDGDIVIVKRQSDVDSGDVAVVLVNGDNATVKQITKSATGLTLIGWNLTVYTPRTYNKEECQKLPVSILGKVVEIRGKL